MTKYQIWYQRDASSGRAPESVFLDEDYTWAGEMEASGIKDLVSKIATTDASESDLIQPRQLKVGDVVSLKELAYILTPVGIWALVEAFGGDGYKNT